MATQETLLAQASLGFRSTLISYSIRVLCKAVSVVTLARLLVPAEHGLFAMAATVSGALWVFRDLGLGLVFIQSKGLSQAQCAAIARAQIGLGLVWALATVAVGPFAAGYFREPQITRLLAVMAVTCALIGLGGFSRASLARELKFQAINRLETVAAVLATIASIAAAAWGAGAYAFAVFLIVSEGVAAALALRLHPLPEGAPDWTGFRSMLRQGAELTGYQIASYGQQVLDIFLVGRWFGAAPLGLYSRSGQLMLLPTQNIATPLTQVMLPTLARLGPDSVHFREHLRTTQNLVAYLTLPLAAVCIALPEDVVRLVLGPRWIEAAPLLRWLSISAVAGFVSATVYGLCAATGRNRLLLITSIVSLVVMAVALIIGGQYGLTGFVVALALANWLMLTPRVWWATRGGAARISDFATANATPFIAATTLGLGLAAGAAVGALTGSDAIRLISGAAGGAAACALLFAAWPRFRMELRNAWRHRPGAVGRPNPPASESTPQPSPHREPTRIAFDTSGLYVTRAGIARYIRGLQRGFEQARPANLEIQPLAWEVENFGYAQPRRMLKTAYRELVWGPWVAPQRMRAQRAELLHSTASLFIHPPHDVPHVITLHDLSVARHPERFRSWQVRTWHSRTPVFATADRVICISRFTADEGMKLLNLRASRITVVPNGCDWHQDEIGFAERAPEFAAPSEFFLFVGSLEPGKNLALLRAAYALAESAGRALPPLLIVGARWEGVATEGRPPSNWHYLGHQPDEVLLYFYRRAIALLFPSKYEGFGLPIVEAMAQGCPVVCSPVASLPEVAGGAALMVPLEAQAYVGAMRDLLADTTLRADLIQRGLRQSAQFTWRRCAAETAAVYREVLGQ